MNDNIETTENITAEKPRFSPLDIGFAVFAIAMGYLFIKLVLAGGLGLGTTLFFAIFLMGTVIYLKKQDVKFTPMAIVQLAVIGVFSLAFVLFDNGFLKALNLIFLTIAIPLWVYFTCMGNHKIVPLFFFDGIRALYVLPFKRFGTCFAAMFSGKRKSGKYIAMVLGGLCLAFPITAIITLLLNSDPMFESIFSSIFSDWNIHLKVFIFQFVVGIPVGCYLFGMLYANSKGVTSFSDEGSESFLKALKIIPTLVVCTAVTPVCLIYLLYFFSQTAYFLSAFQGILPAGFTYSEYARTGFFELCAVVVLNLGLISTMQIFCKNTSDGEKPKALRGYTLFLSVATMILIVTALSKMFLYIGELGLTQLRVYTSWFMILLFFVFLFIGVKQAAKRFPLAKILVTTFTVMFFILQFGCIDYVIADYNVDRYLEGSINSIDCEDYATSAIPFKKLSAGESKSYYWYYAGVEQGFREWNVTEYVAHKTAVEFCDKYNINPYK